MLKILNAFSHNILAIMTTKPKLDELIQYVAFYTQLRTLFHLYTLPFIFMYIGWIYGWCGIYGFDEHYEGGFLGLAIIGCIQILCCLGCYWSVHVNSFFTCKKVNFVITDINILITYLFSPQERDINKVTIVKVVPTPNNGSSELVRLHHSKVFSLHFKIFNHIYFFKFCVIPLCFFTHRVYNFLLFTISKKL